MSGSGEITAVRCGHCGTQVAPSQRQCHSCGHLITPSTGPAGGEGPAPTDFGSFAGPRVHAQRGQSADEGGGMVSVFAGWVQIQGSVRSRQLGAMQDLRSVVFRDRQGQEATLTFGDGTAWRLEGDAGGELLAFMLEIERRMAVPGLVQQPPPLSNEIAAAVTPDVKRNAGGVVAACAFAWVLTMLVRMWSPLGYVLFAVVALGVIAFFLGRQELGPPLSSRWSAWCEGSPVIAGAMALALVFGGALGMSKASSDRALATAAAAEKQQRDDAARAELEAEERAREVAFAKLPALRTTMQNAIAQRAWAEAKVAHDAMVAIDPASADAAAMLPAIEQGLGAQREADRRKAFVYAVAQIPRVAKDKVECESAGIVSSLWHGLQGGTPADPEWPQVAALVPKLEACRRRVVAAYALTTVDSRRMQRGSSASGLQRSLRERGNDVSVELTGRDADTMKISFAAIDDAWIDKLTDSGDVGEGSFLKRRQDEGVRTVELRDGRKVVRSYRLQPARAAEVGKQVLERFDLAEPLHLPAN